MTRAIEVDPADAVSIWRQIENGVRRIVACGGMKPGEAVPSVRDLARDLRVNPATVAKAYQRLTDEGLLEVRRGEGTFVAAAPPALPQAERLKALREGAARYAGTALGARFGRDEAAGALDDAFARLEAASRTRTDSPGPASSRSTSPC